MASFIIDDLKVDYEVIRRDVKYPRLEIKTDYLYLIIPSEYEKPEELLEKHKNWIYKKISVIKASQREAETRKLELERSDEEFKNIVFSLVDKVSHELKVCVNQIRFRRMKSRWGSCSSKGNVNFNMYLKYLPPLFIEYIVFHEIAHLVEMGHNKKFWDIISTKFPDHKELEAELLIYWLSVKERENIV